MNIQLANKPVDLAEEKLVTLRGIDWHQFKTIAAQLENNRTVRLTYLAGVLEIMSPVGRKHEYVKSSLALLLEAYMREIGMRFYRTGGYTIEEPGYAAGEPDESYCIGSDKEVPDIVIEIIVTSGTINRKELYKPKKVPEVWFWKANQIKVFRYRESGEYEEVTRSEFFPDLDLSWLLRYLEYEDQYDAVNEFTEFIRHLKKQ